MMLHKRNIAIDVMKFFAALLITNSHMGMMYTKFSSLATGGAIGDAIFFFCSGFTLFLGQERRFDNWYKRRISRIYPTVIAWAIVTAFFINDTYSIRECITKGGGWFIPCIMIYYIVIYFVRKLFKTKLWLAFITAGAFTLFYYYYTGSYYDISIYGEEGFRLIFFFLYMLLGAIVGQKYQNLKIKKPAIWLFTSLILFNILLLIRGRIDILLASFINVFTLIILLVICISFYACCNTEVFKKIYNSKPGLIIQFIGGLCLEIYVVQHAIITPKLNSIFPLNILIIFVAIVFAAYLLRCFAKLFLQTFQKEDYNWKEILKLI